MREVVGFRAWRGLLLSCALFLLGGVLASNAAGQTESESPVKLTTSLLRVDEGGSVSYSVSLSSQPFVDVNVAVDPFSSVGRGSNNNRWKPPHFKVSRDYLTFTPENWDTPQKVTVSVAEDDDWATNWSVKVKHVAFIPFTDENFFWGEAADLNVEIRDNDAVNQGTVTITPVAGEVTEGDPVQFLVRLDPAPTELINSGSVNAEWVGDFSDSVFDDPISGVNLQIEANTSTKIFTFHTVDDKVDEPDGSIRGVPSGLSFDGYRVGSPDSATVLIKDNDGGPPMVEITGVPPRINSTAAFTAAFAFSADVTGFATGDVRVTGGTKRDFTAGSATEYTLEVTPDGTGDVTVEVAANSATAGFDTGPASPVSATATWDATAPRVTIGGVPPKINSKDPLTVTFTFSEDVTGFTAGDVTVTGGTKGAGSPGEGTYTLEVTPDGSEDVVVTVAANAATDGLNTGPPNAVSATAEWDATAPTVAIGVPPKINSTAAFTAAFLFSEDVTGFETGDVTVTGGTKRDFTAGSATEYTLEVTPDGAADVVVEVAQAAAADAVGNRGPAGKSIVVVAEWDATAPTVGIGGVPARINATSVLTATFTFSEAVTDFVIADVRVTGGTKGDFTAGSATEYTLEVTPDGAADVVVEVAANAATDGLNTGPESAVSATATWDATAPSVKIGGVPARINATSVLTAAFEFSEPVTGFVTADVTVTGGTKGQFSGSGASYALEVTPDGSADVVVTVAEDAATGGLGNTGPANAVSATAEWDATAPTVAIGVPAKINSTGAFTATFEFSEDVTDFVTGDVTVTGGTKGDFAGGGSSYTLVVTPSGSVDVTVEVAANAATDGLNTGPTSVVSATAEWDATAPTVAIGVPAKINSTGAFTATFEFSEDVTDFVTGDVTVTGGTKGDFAGGGSSYTLVVTPSGSKDVVVTVEARSATDGGGNTGPAHRESATSRWDATAPTVTITGVPPAFRETSSSFRAKFEFSEPVTDFDTDDVEVRGATKGRFSGIGGTYYLRVTLPRPPRRENVVVTVKANAATDDGGNTGPANAVSATSRWDTTAPTMRLGGVPAKINSMDDFTATFEFSEDVTGFVKADVTVTGGTKGDFSGGGSSYTLVVTPDGSADVKVEVPANAATDGVNTGPANAVSATATWDATVPTVQVTGVPPKINSRAALSVTFEFSEAVTEFVTGDVTVTGGAKSAFTAGSATSYTLVVTPDGSEDVVVTVAANAATDGVNTGPASAVSATAEWDATPPTVEIGGVPAKINSRAALSVTFTFSEAVTDFVTGDVTVTGGTKGAFTGNGSSYTLPVTPTGSQDVVVRVAANAATDGLNTGPASAQSARAEWDATPPTVEIGGVPPKINSRAAFTATLEFSEDVTDFVTGDVTVTGGAKSAFTAGSATSYTLVVTPDGSEDVVVTVAANAATDGVNTGPASAVSATAEWDATPPTVEIGGVPAKINSRAALSVTFTFSEAVTDFVTGDVTVTGGTKGAFTGNGSSYTLPVTPTGSQDVVVRVAANAATDGLNTGPASAQSARAEWDATPPTVEIGGVPPKINSRAAFTATLEFSEDVTDFVTGDVTVTGGAKSAFTAGSATSYTLVVTPDGSEDVVVTVAANAATDGVNTGPASAVSARAEWDATPPTVEIGGVPAKINSRAALSVTFEFSEPVTGFVTGDVTVTGGTKGAFTGNGSSYTLPVTPTGSQDVVVRVAANAATDGLNTGPASAQSARAEWDATDGRDRRGAGEDQLEGGAERDVRVLGARDGLRHRGRDGDGRDEGRVHRQRVVVHAAGDADGLAGRGGEGGGERGDRRPQHRSGLGAERQGGVGRDAPDGRDRRGAGEDQLEGGAERDVRVLGAVTGSSSRSP